MEKERKMKEDMEEEMKLQKEREKQQNILNSDIQKNKAREVRLYNDLKSDQVLTKNIHFNFSIIYSYILPLKTLLCKSFNQLLLFKSNLN